MFELPQGSNHSSAEGSDAIGFPGRLLWSSGLWRSLVARDVWDVEVVGSSPTSPTIGSSPKAYEVPPCMRVVVTVQAE